MTLEKHSLISPEVMRGWNWRIRIIFFQVESLLMVQFPSKPARESTSLSGGEKTMAAIVFLLALQSLKPSPFYLMDEVDAHLDAQNTDRLSRILLLRSVNNQIIMVTLKDSTVAKSDLIFGVYPRNGISQVVKYNHPSKVKLEVDNLLNYDITN